VRPQRHSLLLFELFQRNLLLDRYSLLTSDLVPTIYFFPSLFYWIFASIPSNSQSRPFICFYFIFCPCSFDYYLFYLKEFINLFLILSTYIYIYIYILSKFIISLLNVTPLWSILFLELKFLCIEFTAWNWNWYCSFPIILVENVL
jgi:hypothetical protein